VSNKKHVLSERPSDQKSSYQASELSALSRRAASRQAKGIKASIEATKHPHIQLFGCTGGRLDSRFGWHGLRGQAGKQLGNTAFG
jgi:hypothetical protein